jgi:3-oxoacyl-[acyl-carrier-protein] synthase II
VSLPTSRCWAHAGAAGAIEAVVTIQTIRTGCVPPTINLEMPDPAGEGST